MSRRTPTATEIETRLEELRWTQKQFAQRLRISANLAWKLTNVGPASREEADKVVQVLWPHLTAEDLERPDQDIEEWRGLSKGDPCRLVAKTGNLTRFPYTFDYFHWSPFGSYAHVTRTDTGNPKECPPEDVRGARGQELPPES